jgi:hypothetical protein
MRISLQMQSSAHACGNLALLPCCEDTCSADCIRVVYATLLLLLLLLLQGAGLLAEGAELLLEIINPGIIGGEAAGSMGWCIRGRGHTQSGVGAHPTC